MLGGRPASMVLRELMAPRNYIALARMPRIVRRPADFARRYFLGGGSYPYVCELATPVGRANPTLYSHHDVWTVNEVFAREDYRVSTGIRTVVDVGSNIGISALYFLTRNPDVVAYLYEPEPRNAERLVKNLADFADRWKLERRAVGPEAGSASFGREATGRYGGIGVETGETIEVEVAGINDVLERVLGERHRIDVLKIDTEGLEVPTVSAIHPNLLDGVDLVYFESPEPVHPHGDRFVAEFRNETVALRRRS